MMDRIIEVKVSGNFVTKDNKNAGTQGEYNITTMRIEFDPGWDGFAKHITFWDALGHNPVEIILTTNLLENIGLSTRVYRVLIPGEPLAVDGNMSFVIDGYIDGVRQRSVEDHLTVKPAKSADGAEDPADPTPSQAEQLQVQIDKIAKEIVRASEAADAKEAAEESAKAAANSEAKAANHADNARQNANTTAEAKIVAVNAKNLAEEYCQRAEATLGKSPYISDNGLWVVWDEEAGHYVHSINAQGPAGKDGKDGQSVTAEVIGESTAGGAGNVVRFYTAAGAEDLIVYNGKDGYTPIKGKDYFDGEDGANGQSVTAEIIAESTEGGGLNIVRFHTADGDKVLTVYNGKDGSDGLDGYTPVKGLDYFDGEDGYTPVKGTDYFDGYTPIKGKDYFDGEDGQDGVNGRSVYYSGDAYAWDDGEYRLIDFKDILLDGHTPQTGELIITAAGHLVQITEVGNEFVHAQHIIALEGKDGVDGKDGQEVTAEVIVESESGGAGNVIRFHTADDVVDLTVYNGKDGKDGVDGYTPVKGIDYFDGVDGYTPVKGKDYFDGVDGKDVRAEVVAQSGVSGGASTVRFYTASGTTDLLVYNGNDGKDGADGVDGRSVYYSSDDYPIWEEGATRTFNFSSMSLDGRIPQIGELIVTAAGFLGRITFVDISFVNAELVCVLKGEDGDTPVKGIDYYTPEEKNALVQEVVAEALERGVGEDVSGDEFEIDGEAVVAGFGAERFNNYSQNKPTGSYSHSEGVRTTASGSGAHAEGFDTTASGSGAHAEGLDTTASGSNAHAEGKNTVASGNQSHAEGLSTNANNIGSHAEGSGTTASGFAAHAEGYDAVAGGYASHAEGKGTIAAGSVQHVQGQYNIADEQDPARPDRGRYIHIVGNGTSDEARSNAHTVDWDGNAWYAGDIEVKNAVILASPNGTRYKITVSDNGTLSATPVS